MSEQQKWAEKMNILQVVPRFDPSWGGPFTLVNAISRGLVKKGHDVSILTSSSKSNLKDFTFGEIREIKIHFLRNCISSNKLNLYLSLDLPRFLSKQVQDFDVIHLQGYRNYHNLVTHHYANKFRVPYILQAHGTLPTQMGKSGIKHIFDKVIGTKMIKAASKVIAINELEGQQYHSLGIPRSKIKVIPNGIDLSEYQTLPPPGNFRTKFSIGENQNVILFLGRLHKIKGLDILIKAFANVLHEYSTDIKLVIVGPDEGYLNQVEFLVSSLKIEDYVAITGPIFGKNKIEVFVDSDIFVLPSRYEIFGLSLIEAAACGKPVIASKIDNLKGLLLENETGNTFEVGDVKQLTDALIFLLKNEDIRRNYGNAGREFVNNKFNINDTVNQLESLYRESLKTTKC